MDLRGYDLRYLLTSLILDHGGTASTADLRLALTELGVDLGPDPRRRLYGALRSEVRKRRVRPLGAGRYAIDELPRSTRSHIRRRVDIIRAAIEQGLPHPPPPHRYETSSCDACTAGLPLDHWPIARTLDDLRFPSGQRLRDAQSGRVTRREDVGHGKG